MIAENFYRHGFALFYPQINWAGAAPGYVGTEFPLVPFMAAVLYGMFGVQAWVGRAVSVGFFALSVPFFYRLVRQTSDAHAALWAVAIYTLTPLSIFASRAFMPDMASLSLSLVALSLFATWLERAPHAPLFLATSLAISLAILVKLPAILIGVPLLAMAWSKYGVRAVCRRELVALAALALGAPLAWYTHAYRISLTYPPYHFFGTGVLEIVGGRLVCGDRPPPGDVEPDAPRLRGDAGGPRRAGMHRLLPGCFTGGCWRCSCLSSSRAGGIMNTTGINCPSSRWRRRSPAGPASGGSGAWPGARGPRWRASGRAC